MKPVLPTTIVRSVEEFAIDGPIGLSVALALGLALAVWFAWLLHREARILGPSTSLACWVLRTTAVALVLWMLLAPTVIRVETATTPREIAIVVDVSGSMQTVDPEGAADELRWLPLAGAKSPTANTAAVDSAVAALGRAEREVQSAIEALRQHRVESEAVESMALANEALSRLGSHLQSIRESRGVASEIRALAERVLDRCSDPEFQSFAQLSRALQKGRTPPQKGWRESLPDVAQRLKSLQPALHKLARQVVDDDRQQLNVTSPGALVELQQQNRLTRLANWLAAAQAFSTVANRANVRSGAFDQTLRWLSHPQELATQPSGSSDGTDLSAVLAALQREQQQRRLAAVFVLSDFAHNRAAAKSPAEVAAALAGTPVYAVPIGNAQHLRDVQLQSVFAPSVAMRNDDIVIEARVQAYDCAGETCFVQLLQHGQPVEQREIAVDAEYINRTVRFERHVPAVGMQSYRVAVLPLDGESSAENNARDLEVNVTRSDIKLLLADELPRWEYRYLAQLFRRDPKVECDELLFQPRVIATGRRAESEGFPVTVDEWDQYDVVLLGDVAVEHLPVAAQKSLAEYLQQRGGTLVVIAGRESMPHAYRRLPLEDLLPVLPLEPSPTATSDSYVLRVTEQGRDHPALLIGTSEDDHRAAWEFVNKYAPVSELSTWRQPRASARTLLAAISAGSRDEQADLQRSAYLCWQPVGRGRVVYLSAPESFRLRFLRGDTLHYRFWGQLLRWAIASELSGGSEFVRLRTDKTRYLTDETVHITVRLTNVEGQPVMADGLQIRVTADAGERLAPLVPDPQISGEYSAELQALSPADYRVEALGAAIEALHSSKDSESSPATANFTVQAVTPGESIDTRCDRVLAQQIAEVTGGQVIPPTAVAEVLRLTRLEPEVTETMERRPLWLQWKYLWLIFGCLQGEWIIRKWLGVL